MSVIIILFLLLFCSSISGFGVGQYSIKQAFFLGGGGVRGTPALDTHGKGCNQSLNIKLLDSFERCWLMAVVC